MIHVLPGWGGRPESKREGDGVGLILPHPLSKTRSKESAERLGA
jgi:hypothetical protein